MTDGNAAIRWSLIVLAACALFTALSFGQAVFAPLLLAFVIGVVLAPVTDRISAVGVPRLAATVLVLAGTLGAITVLGLALEPVVWRLVDRLPQIWLQLRETLIDVRGALGGFDLEAGLAGDAAGEAEDAVPSLTDALFLAPAVAAQVLIFVGALFFFLLSRVEVYDYLSRHRVLSDRPRDVGRILLVAESRVSSYFLTILCINAVFGSIVCLAMWLVGMPSPYVWGLVAFLFNFILYLGPITVAVLLLIAGSMTFTGLQVFVPAAVFVGLNSLEGQFVTPALVGRTLHVSPLLVFLSLVFWLWLWGPLGGFIAIPLLVWIVAVSVPDRADAHAVEGTLRDHEREMGRERGAAPR